MSTPRWSGYRVETKVDVSRIAIVGSGSGGNVAYVSLGNFPEQIKTGVSLSAGLWAFHFAGAVGHWGRP